MKKRIITLVSALCLVISSYAVTYKENKTICEDTNKMANKPPIYVNKYFNGINLSASTKMDAKKPPRPLLKTLF